MSELFLKILNMSISAGWIVLAVVVLRLLLKKAPRWSIVALWGIVALRLVFPFSIESVLSLIPSGQTVSPEVLLSPKPSIESGIPALNATINPVLGSSFAPNPGDSVNPLQVWTFVFAVLWVAGIVVMAVYAAVSSFLLHRKVATAVRIQENIFVSEWVQSPFVFGFLKPKIYLPSGMGEADAAFVIAHEQAHICRKDHWWKPLGFMLLSVYWFHPLMWVAYILLCRDIEMACDEKVISRLEKKERADYSQALLTCSVHKMRIAACPLAFGEVGVKERVKNVLKFKKPAIWIIVLAIMVCVVTAVCFLTDPVSSEQTDPSDPLVEQESGFGNVEKLYDKYDSVSSNRGELTLEAFPDITFRWDYRTDVMDASEGLIMVKDGEEKKIFPASNDSVFVADVTGDGKPDLCANCYYFFSGRSDFNAVYVYDIANDAMLVLGDLDNWDHDTLVSYYIRIEEDALVCDKVHVATRQTLATGDLVFVEETKQLQFVARSVYDNPMQYIFTGEHFWNDRVRLTVCANGKFTISFNPKLNEDGTSSWVQGTYNESENRLTIRTEEGKLYAFETLEDGNLRFMQAESDPLPQNCPMGDGGILVRTPFFPE